MNKVTSHKIKQERRISYTAIAVVALYLLSVIVASFWPLSGWWLVATFTLVTSAVLIFANYKDGRDSKVMLRPVAIGLTLVGLRLATIGTGPDMMFRSVSYTIAGALMMLVGGAMAGYLLANYKGKSK